jgi:polar amino acid transport system substrate-binding protein
LEARARSHPILRSGWYDWEPYQYLDRSTPGKDILTGLDIEMTKAIAAHMGFDVSYEEVSWQQHQMDVRDGVRDIAVGAFVTPYREEYAYFSVPYRDEINVLYVRRGESRKYSIPDIDSLLQRMSQGKFTVTVLEGYSYALPAVNSFVRDPKNAEHIVFAKTWAQSFEVLRAGQVDGILIDRIVAATFSWRHELQGYVEEHPMTPIKDTVHAMFSKKTMPPEIAEKFAASLQAIRDSGLYDKIYREYFYPVIVSLTVRRPWFFGIDLLGTIAFALSGVLLARKERYSIVGALLLASLPGVGGGIVRDLVVNRHPLGVLQTPSYLIAILITVVAGYAFFRLLPSMQAESKLSKERLRKAGDWLVQTGDAIGLAAFTVTGVVVALQMKAEPLWLWGPLLATITAAGGGVIRDMVRADAGNPTLKGTCYAEISLIWGLILSLYLLAPPDWYGPTETFTAVLITLAGAFLTRMAVIALGIRSLIF